MGTTVLNAPRAVEHVVCVLLLCFGGISVGNLVQSERGGRKQHVQESFYHWDVERMEPR